MSVDRTRSRTERDRDQRKNPVNDIENDIEWYKNYKENYFKLPRWCRPSVARGGERQIF